jgi:hypothetical protein
MTMRNNFIRTLTVLFLLWACGLFAAIVQSCSSAAASQSWLFVRDTDNDELGISVGDTDGTEVILLPGGSPAAGNIIESDGSGNWTYVAPEWTEAGGVLSPTDVGDIVQIASTATSGNSFKVSRNLAAGSTDADVVLISQENAADDREALTVLQGAAGQASIGIVSDGGGIGILSDEDGIEITADTDSTNDETHGIAVTTQSTHNAAYGVDADSVKVTDYVDFAEVAAPASAPVGAVRAYAKTDGLMYATDDTADHKLSNILTIVAKVAAYTALITDDVITCDTTGGAFTIDLYAVAGNSGRTLHIIREDSSGNDLTIDGNGAETIHGNATITLADSESVHLVCDGTEWWVM